MMSKFIAPFYPSAGPHSTQESRHHSHAEREINDLRITLGKKDRKIGDLEARCKELEEKNRDLDYSLSITQEDYDDMIRKQQEGVFKQMDTGRWLPQEESKIKGDLDRLKRTMKSWAKDCSINSMAHVQSLMEGTDEEVALSESLSNVVRLDGGRLPPGLTTTTSKTPSLLLNALLAHDVYKTLFENPFFFFNDQLDYEKPRLAADAKFSQIYQSMLGGKLYKSRKPKQLANSS
jgi:hypothetical protein